MKSVQTHKSKTSDFEETSSIVQRLRAIIIAINLLIVIGFAAVYLMSRPFLTGLQEMKASNMTLTSISSCLEAIDSSIKRIESLTESKDTADFEFTFRESQKLFTLNLDIALQNAENFPKVKKELINIKKINTQFENSVRALTRKNYKSNEEFLAEMMIVKEYTTDIQENLRRSTILMKKNGDEIFSRIYAGRFNPLIAAVIISTVFISFVIVFGFSVTDRLRKSLRNLFTATEEISDGNFNYRAEVLRNDEIGKVTHAFNEMIHTLSEIRQKNQLSKERISLLQTITAAFSEALTPNEIFEIIISKGFKALNTEAGVIAVLSADGTRLEFPRLEGYPGEKIFSYSSDAATPMADSIREGRPIFIESLEELLSLYPDSDANRSRMSHATAVLPMSVGTNVLGALAFSYPHARAFSHEDKEFMIAFARQSAQALHRSQLFENSRLAIQTRDEFLSIASHELKTPLTPLKLQLQSLIRQINKSPNEEIHPDKINKIVESSDKQISRLAHLIEDLLDVSRISAGKLTLNKEKLNLAEMVDDVVKHYRAQLKEVLEDIQIQGNSHIDIYADKVRLEQVLINLLTNAGKYAPGKPVIITLSTANNYAHLQVADQGPGISEIDQSRVFDRFERVRERGNIGGLGLGLYISKQIVEAHGGKISVKSKPGSGATFLVEIPL